VKVLFDTSVLVAAVVAELKSHEAALDCFIRYSAGNHEGYCTTHTLAECYATLTALPLRRRVQPAEARRLVIETIRKRLKIIALPETAYFHAVERVSELGLVSGVTYDALHLEAAESRGCRRLYTHNLRHFERLNPDGVQITAP